MTWCPLGVQYIDLVPAGAPFRCGTGNGTETVSVSSCKAQTKSTIFLTAKNIRSFRFTCVFFHTHTVQLREWCPNCEVMKLCYHTFQTPYNCGNGAQTDQVVLRYQGATENFKMCVRQADGYGAPMTLSPCPHDPIISGRWVRRICPVIGS